MTFVTCICASMLGALMNAMGYSLSDWQPWVIFALYLIPNAGWMYKDFKNER